MNYLRRIAHRVAAKDIFAIYTLALLDVALVAIIAAVICWLA